jgi:hypothetical protein
MTAEYPRILPWILAALAVLMIYRRLRRSFGKQLLRPTRMMLRAVLLIAVAASLVPIALRSQAHLLAELAGTALGLSLALWGARHTRFLTDRGQTYYVPHTHTGIAVSLLVLARIVYRFVEIYADGGPAGAATMVQSPLTVGLLFVLIAYYVYYYGAVLWRSRHLEPSDLEAPATPSAESANALTRSDTISG